MKGKIIHLFFLVFLLIAPVILKGQGNEIIIDALPELEFCPGSTLVITGTCPFKEKLLVQISRPNSDDFSESPIIIGSGKKLPLIIQIPFTTEPGTYFIRVVVEALGISNTIKITVSGNYQMKPLAQASGSYDGIPDDIYDLVADKEGNLYVTGTFFDNLKMGGKVLEGYDQNDIFLSKYDTSGKVKWALQLGGDLPDAGYGVALDDYGDVYITGTFSGVGNFGTIKLNAVGKKDIFIAKVDKGGTVLWAKSAGSTGNDMGGGRITVDKFGNIFIAGYFTEPCSFEGKELVNQGQEDIFISQYDQNGKLKWVKSYGGLDSDIPSEIHFDPHKNLFLTGWFKGTSTFGSNTISSHGGYDIFVSKFDYNGDNAWSVNIGGPSDDYGRGIAADHDGNSYVTGSFNGSATFGSSLYNAQDGDDLFIAKLNTGGSVDWVTTLGGNKNETGRAIALDPSKSIFVTGWANSEKLGREDVRDILFVRLNEVGEISYKKTLGNGARDFSRALDVDITGTAYFAGSFTGKITFDNNKTLQSSNGQENLFIAKVGCTATFPFKDTLNLPDITIFPNPAENGVFFIYDTSEADLLFVSIYTDKGEQIYPNVKFIKYHNRIRIDLSSYNRGLYMVSVANGWGVSCKKVWIR